MEKRFPFKSYPTGWFVVAMGTEVPKGKIVTKHYFGEDIVLYRTESGTANAVRPYCAHMGAHLGHGGTVVGETIRCPMHGFRYNGDGRCVATGYEGQVPARARLRRWPLREINGFIFLWYDAKDREPDWEIPVLDESGWRPQLWHRYEFTSHPQEITENSVDFGHFGIVHGFTKARISRPAVVDGPLLEISYEAERPYLKQFTDKYGSKVAFDIKVHGLGFSQVVVRIPMLGATIRQWMCASPVNETKAHYLLCESILPLPGLFRPLTRLVHRASFEAFCYEVRQDIPMWENKTYMTKPALAKGDGPIGLYRQWCKQFYPLDGSSKSRASRSA